MPQVRHRPSESRETRLRNLLCYLKRDRESITCKMLRAGFISLSSSRISVRTARPLVVLGTRLNSSQTPEQKRALNKAKEELQKDWIAPILTYEEVKHKSQQPSEVRATLPVHSTESQTRPRVRI